VAAISAYQYTPYVWPTLACAAFMAALGIYLWRQRTLPGALPLVVWMFLAAVLSVGSALEMAAVQVQTKSAWFTFQSILVLPCATAMLCFSLEYAKPGRWVNRGTVVLLSLVPLLAAVLMITNDLHGWVWSGLPFQRELRPVFGPGAWVLTGYGYLLLLGQMGVLAWLFVVSPPHRWPVVLLMISRLWTAVVFGFEPNPRNPFAPLDGVLIAFTVTAVIYAFVLLRFRLLNLIPIARETVIQQMREGMLIIDAQMRIADLNRSAERILRARAGYVRGRPLADVVPALAGFPGRLDDSDAAKSEICLHTGGPPRYYAIQVSPLRDGRGPELGYLFLLHDVTEQRRARQQLLEQQRVVAILEERQRLARELHDGVGQMLGYVSLQAQAIRKRVHDGETDTAEAQLARLADAARDAHGDVRESILSLKAGSAQGWEFFATLRRYLDSFRDHYGIATELVVSDGMGETDFTPASGVHLLRVIQEALTNARKHGKARCVSITLGRAGRWARVVVSDDGCGFEPAQASADDGDHLGLAFMRERMQEIGGNLAIDSRPGAGTRLVLRVPIYDEPSRGDLSVGATREIP
jgi:PAS domain S-box-containing protein